MNRKLVSAALTVATVAWSLGVASLPLANAQTTADLQAQIAALLAQIQQLQSQLNTAQGGGSSSAYNFTRDLTVGSKGADVTALQQLLISKGYLAVSAPTGYFGSLTKAAVAKWQAAVGLSPAAGYFGPKSRAFLASAGGGTTGSTTTGGGTTGGATVPASGLAVSLSSQNPAAGSIISSSGSGAGSAARVPVLAINLTASNSGAVTVTDLKVHKLGVLSDSSVSGAYLIQNGQVLFQYTSLNQGTIDFSGMNLSVPAGQTQTLWVAIDPSSGLNPGNTVSFAVNSAADVTAFDGNNTAVTASGMFPLTGNIFTVTQVSNPQLATLSTVSSSIATQVTAGTQNNIIGAWTFTGSNSKTWLKGIKFTVIGSANNADLRNVKLNVNGTQVDPTLASVLAGGIAYFDLSATPASLNTGSNNIQVYADVMGSPSKNFDFEILNSYDVYAVDSQYNVPIAVSLGGGAGTPVSIQQGQITVTQDSATPTGNIAVGQSGVTLAKFDIYAAGEAVKVKFLGFELKLSSVATSSNFTTLSNFVKNVSLVDDAGGQVGTTINNPPSSNSCDSQTGADAAAGLSSGTVTAGTVVYLDCFGTSASPINYIVPANTTRVLSLKADIQSLTSPATFTTITGKLGGNSNNLQGLISSQTGSSSGASGSSLSLQSTLLSVTQNSAYGNQTVTPNSTGVKIGSYAFTASSASGVQINTVSVKAAPNSSGSTDLQNLKVMVSGSQFGTTQGVVGDTNTYTFSGSPFTVPAGGTTYVDVYADILSNATTTNPASSLSGCSGTSVVSYSSVSCPTTAISGQKVTIATTGATISVGLDSSAPAAGQLVMGSTGNVLAAFRLAETSNVENVKVTDLVVKQTTAATSSAYQNVTLWSGATALGTSGSAATTTGGFTYSFHFASPVVVPQSNSVTVTLKGDVASYSALSNAGVDNTTSTFGMATSTVTALGQSSNITSAVTGGATGNTMTVLRTVLTPSATALGNTSNRTKSSVDNLATVTFTANTAGSAMLQTLKLTFSGNAIATSTATSTGGGTAFLGNITLRDANNNDVTVADGAYTTNNATCATQSSCSVIWTFATTTTPFIVSGGSSYTFTIQLNDTAGTLAASGNNAVSIGATVQQSGDVTYYDAGQVTGAASVSLPSTIVPLNVMSVTFTPSS